MFKIWAKVIREHKIRKDYLYHSADKFDIEQFRTYLEEICHEMDVPTPIVLRCHTRNFLLYNVTKFRPEDFVEAVDFDLLQIENASE